MVTDGYSSLAREIRATFLNAFPRLESWELLTREALDTPISQVTLGRTSLVTVADDVLSYAETQNLLSHLLEEACQLNSDHPGLRTLPIKYKQVPPNIRLFALYDIRNRIDQDPIIPFRVPISRNSYFVGHESQLISVEAALASGQRVAITGMTGKGKTQFAAELAYRAYNAKAYPGGIFWLKMTDSNTVLAEFAAWGEAGSRGMSLSGWQESKINRNSWINWQEAQEERMRITRNIDLVRSALSGTKLRLLIFDALEDYDLFKQLELPQVGGYRVLITTRQGYWSAARDVVQIPLDDLELEAARKLLLTPRARKQHKEAEGLLADVAVMKVADGIIAELGRLPLALALAGAYLEWCPTVSLTEYHKALQQERLHHESLSGKINLELESISAPSVLAAFSLNYNQLNSRTRRDALAIYLLQLSAVCADAPIPRRLLFRAASPDQLTFGVRLYNRLRHGTWRMAPHLTKILPLERAVPALNRLLELGLLEYNDKLAEMPVRLHPLLAFYIRERSTLAGVTTRIESALTFELTDDQVVYSTKSIVYIPHLIFVIENAIDRTDIDLAKLLNNAATLLLAHDRLNEARIFSERALAIAERERPIKENNFIPEHLTIASYINTLALILKELGELKQAFDLLQRAMYTIDSMISLSELSPVLNRAMKFLPPLLLMMAIQTLNNLGSILQDLGNFEASYEAYTRSLEMAEQLSSTSPSLMPMGLDNLANLSRDAGDLENARNYWERALAIREQEGINDHHVVANLVFLSEIFQAQGDIEQANILLIRAIPLSEILDTSNFAHFDILNRLALQLTRNNSSEALAIYQRLLLASEDIFGVDNPVTQAFRQILHN